MIHYLESIFPTILSYSQKLDKLALLLDEPWVVVSDDNNQTKLIFRKDGSLLVSENGSVTFGKWHLLNRANSILIEYSNSVKLYNHSFFDEAVLALKVDGTNDYFVIINQNQVPDLNIIAYLKNKYIDQTSQSSRVNTQEPTVKSQIYLTDKGEIMVSFQESWRGSPFNGDKVYMNNKQAPDGKYKINFMEKIHVKNGRVFNTTMF